MPYDTHAYFVANVIYSPEHAFKLFLTATQAHHIICVQQRGDGDLHEQTGASRRWAT
jgi:hypothetical protein